MPIDRPIFIVAPPRCGTTLLYQCLVEHPEVGFFNRANGNWPNSPRFAHFLTKAGGLVGSYRDTPRESRSLWFRFFPQRADDVADERDATPAIRAWYESRIETVLALRGARRLASKLPSHSAQVPFLDALWPDALFLQPIRDWRAVVASTVVKRRRDFDGRWFGVRMPGWQEHETEPHDLGAAWQYRAVHEHLELQQRRFAGRYLPVHYEELLAQPQAVMRKVFDFCGLPADAALLAKATAHVRPSNEKWKETLPPERVAALLAAHGTTLSRYEFLPPSAASERSATRTASAD